ncbi:MAG: AAA family ATPase [Planctomycetia bacterium]
MTQLSLETVTIDGFRGLRNLTLEGLGPVNILVGENNSGKTSVLEALSILCNPLDPYEWMRLIRQRDFGRLDETRIQSLRWCFRQSGNLQPSEAMFREECRMTCEGAFPLRSLSVTYKDLIGEPDEATLRRIERFRGSTPDELDVNEQWFGAELSHKVVGNVYPQPSLFDHLDDEEEVITIQVWENDPVTRPRVRRRGGLPCETLTPYSYQINILQMEAHSKQLFAASEERVVGREGILDLLRMFEPKIRDIQIASFRGRRPALYIDHAELGAAPLSIFGDALRRVVLLASTLYSLGGGGILLIDEVETGIHVSALKQVFSWLTKAASTLGVQIVATTHSLEAVDAIASSVTDVGSDLVTFRLNQTENGTEGKRIHGDLLHRLRFERGLDVR